jgi:hypothetical protein
MVVIGSLNMCICTVLSLAAVENREEGTTNSSQ